MSTPLTYFWAPTMCLAPRWVRLTLSSTHGSHCPGNFDSPVEEAVSESNQVTVAAGWVTVPSWNCTLSSRLRLVRATDPPAGRVWMSSWWPFYIREPRTLPSDGAGATIFSTLFLWRSLVAPAQNDDYLTVLLSQITFPHSPSVLSHKSPLPFRRQIWD